MGNTCYFTIFATISGSKLSTLSSPFIENFGIFLLDVEFVYLDIVGIALCVLNPSIKLFLTYL
jgi:hypothetical protein